MKKSSFRNFLGRMMGRKASHKSKAIKTLRNRNLNLEPLEKREMLSISSFDGTLGEVTWVASGNSALSEAVDSSLNTEPLVFEFTNDTGQNRYIFFSSIRGFNGIESDNGGNLLEVSANGGTNELSIYPINNAVQDVDVTINMKEYLNETGQGEAEGEDEIYGVFEIENDDVTISVTVDNLVAQEMTEDAMPFADFEKRQYYSEFTITRDNTDLTHDCYVTLDVNENSTADLTDYDLFYCDEETAEWAELSASWDVPILAGNNSTTVQVRPVDDADLEAQETLSFNVTDVYSRIGKAYYEGGAHSWSSVYDDDAPDPGLPSLSGSYGIQESNFVTVYINDNDVGIRKVSNASEPVGHVVEGQEIVEGAGIGEFEIYRLSGFNLTPTINFSLEGESTATNDTDEDTVLEGDYELRNSNNGLVLSNYSHTFSVGETEATFYVVPFADLDDETTVDANNKLIEEYVTMAIAMPAGADNVIATGQSSDTLDITNQLSLKPCVCTCCCASGEESFLGINEAEGNLGVGDPENDIDHYSSFADGKATIVVSASLTPENGSYPLEKVKAELVSLGGESPHDSNVIWYDGSGVEDMSYAFTFVQDLRDGYDLDLSTGIHTWQVTLTQYYEDDSSITKDVYGEVSCIDTAFDDNPIGDGWFIFGIPSLLLDGSNPPTLLRSGLQKFETDPAGGWRQAGFHDTSDYSLIQDGGDYYLTSKNGTIEKFNSSGQIVSKTDSDGNVTTYTFTSGKLTGITEPGNRTTTYDYNATSGLLDHITDPDGNVTTYAHDPTTEKITSMTKADPDGDGPLPALVSTFEYTDDFLTKIVNPDGSFTEIEYDFAGKVSKVTNPDGSVEEYESYYTSLMVNISETGYDADHLADLIPYSDGEVTTTIDGEKTISKVDHWGFPVSTIDAEENETIYVRNAAGQVTQMIEPDPDGDGPLSSAITSYEYDARGNMIQITLPSGLTRQWEYDTNSNQVTKYTDELGNTTLYEIDWQTGNVIKETVVIGLLDGDGNAETDDIVTEYTYSPEDGDIPAGLLISRTESSGHIVYYSYNAEGRRTDTFTYDESSEPITVDDSDGGFSSTGDWDYMEMGQESGSYFGKIVDYEDPTAQWSFTGLTPGKIYEVYATWAELSYSTSDAQYEFCDSGSGGSVLLTATVDQRQAPVGHDVGGDSFQSLGFIKVTGEGVVVTLSSPTGTTDEYLNADAIRLVEMKTESSQVYDETTGLLVASIDAAGGVTEYEYDALGRLTKTLMPYADTVGQTLDEEDYYQEYGGWAEIETADGYDGDYYYSDDDSDYIDFRFVYEAGKEYELFATWIGDVDNNAQEVSYVISRYPGFMPLETLTADHRYDPSGGITFGSEWES
ncbi:MAG: hypothetical protein PVH19_11275, partial [Planctomycetia bacterium]